MKVYQKAEALKIPFTTYLATSKQATLWVIKTGRTSSLFFYLYKLKYYS